MKIIYFGSSFSSDFDFPLLREYQRQGVDVAAYFELTPFTNKRGLIDADSVPHKNTILPATQVEAFKVYADYLRLDQIFVINIYYQRRHHWQAWVLWIKVFIHMLRQKASVLHLIWPLTKLATILYRLPCKKVLTVHDPFPHSGQESKTSERCRLQAFKQCDRFVLLNQVMVSDFCAFYHISQSKILLNKLGELDYFRMPQAQSQPKSTPYILFFGQIQPHKGIDLLLEAMSRVHQTYPTAKLIVAGRGNYHFDITPYQNTDYIEFRNHYITVPELAGLLQNALFVVCPYRDATQSGVVQTAFSASVPLIVTNVGSLSEAVTDQVTGLVIPPNDVEALQGAIERLLADKALLAEFRKNIDLHWRPAMQWKPIADKYIQLYKALGDPQA